MNPPLLNRRTFLQAASTAIATTALTRMPLYGGAERQTLRTSTDGTISIPFAEPTEVLICGSTLFACQLALDSAARGWKTTLMIERVNPFFEGISCLRPWIDTVDSEHFPAVVKGVLGPATSEEKAGRSYFNASRAALEIEDRLAEAGVRFYYNTTVAGAVGQAGELKGVVFGGKTGLFGIESATVIDATPEASVARAVGAKFVPIGGDRRFHYAVDLASPVSGRTHEYTASNGARVRVDTHHYFATFDVVLAPKSSGVLAFSEDFEQVYAASLEMPWNGTEKRFRGADGFFCSGLDRLEKAGGSIEGFSNLFVFGPKGIPGNLDGSLVLKDWKSLFKAFPDAVDRIAPQRPAGRQPLSKFEFWNKGVPLEQELEVGLSHGFTDHGFEEPETAKGAVQFLEPALALHSDVLVTGGGTSGNAATYACASLGLNTVCLERGFELGGTNTIGGVTNLWYGNRTKAFNDYYDAMEAKNDGINAPGFYRGVKKAGGRILFGVTLTGVARLGENVERLYIITPFGTTAVRATRHIDATGDGAIAAWAGCAYTYGGEHDELTLWASFAGYKPGRPEALRPFLSPCDERSATDATRFILSMRRNSKISLEQAHVPPPFYLAPRESRHIKGGKTLTFLDLLSGRRFKDGVFRVESNPDIKGLATSDAAKSGFIPTDWRAVYKATVPYAAMIPEGVNNLIIAGKAYSATHDALSAARMQRDLCVMGMVAAEAVRLSADKAVLLRNIPVDELQTTLIAKGMLKAADIGPDDFGFGLTAEEMAKKVASYSSMDACLPVSAMLCLIPRERALKALEAHSKSANPGVERLLCFLGHPTGVERYRSEVDVALNEPELSGELYGGKATKHMMPDQGYAPVCALMLGSLAQARVAQAVPLLVRLAERMNIESNDLRSAWGYFYTVACGFERLAGSEGVAPLRRLLNGPIFQNRTVLRTGDLRLCQDVVSERLSYLKMALSRALLRCGDAAGATHLCDFLLEARVCLARAARAELAIATGQDFGFSPGLWKEWIAANGPVIKPNPLTKTFA